MCRNTHPKSLVVLVLLAGANKHFLFTREREIIWFDSPTQFLSFLSNILVSFYEKAASSGNAGASFRPVIRSSRQILIHFPFLRFGQVQIPIGRNLTWSGVGERAPFDSVKSNLLWWANFGHRHHRRLFGKSIQVPSTPCSSKPKTTHAIVGVHFILFNGFSNLP